MSPSTRSLFLAVAALAPAAPANGVRIVDTTLTQGFGSIGSAVAASPDGGTILVASGTYSGFTITNKSVSIYAMPGADVQVLTSVSVVALHESKTVVIHGLNVATQDFGGLQNPWALRVIGCSGPVRIENCTFEATNHPGCSCPFPEIGRPAVTVASSDRVAFQGCTLRGGLGQGQGPGSTAAASRGGHGLTVLESSVVLYDCRVIGGEGGPAEYTPGAGGFGIELRPSFFESEMLASNTLVRGGVGGLNYLASPSALGGPGGTALTFVGGCCLGTFYDLACTFVPGSGGAGEGSAGPPGATITGGSPIALDGPARRTLVTPAIQPDRSMWTVEHQGQPGEVPRLLVSYSAVHEIAPTLVVQGALLVPRAPLAGVFGLGVADANGALTASVLTEDLPAGLPVQKYHTQSVVRYGGKVWLGSQASLVLLDRESGPDCNANGVSDFVEMLLGTVADANHNLIPDGCPGG